MRSGSVERSLDEELIRHPFYLNRDYEDRGLVILRILDSRRENFRLRSQYAEQYPVFGIYTCPEIEILHILASDRYDAFQKSGLKPSEYFKSLELRQGSKIKSREYVASFYDDIWKLVYSIAEYNHRCSQRGELNLWDLLNQETVSEWNARAGAQ